MSIQIIVSKINVKTCIYYKFFCLKDYLGRWFSFTLRMSLNHLNTIFRNINVYDNLDNIRILAVNFLSYFLCFMYDLSHYACITIPFLSFFMYIFLKQIQRLQFVYFSALHRNERESNFYSAFDFTEKVLCWNVGKSSETKSQLNRKLSRIWLHNYIRIARDSRREHFRQKDTDGNYLST